MNVTEYRNLAEQVQKNKDDILIGRQRDKVLADFGIRIIGQLATKQELDAIPTEGLQYGDAYAIGTESPFNYYIWTRANNISPTDYWFDFGEIAIVGPAGPRGLTGPTGATGQSTRWYLYPDGSWDYPSGKNPGDMALTIPSGNVYIVGDQGIWAGQGNIKGPQGLTGKTGPQGPQGIQGEPGPKGDTGDVGGFINIAGILATEDQLPRPDLIDNLTVAYLIGSAAPYDLYVQVGSTSVQAQWLNAGPLNAATLVTVNGQFQNTWDADTKLDKITTTAPNNRAYVVSYDGRQTQVTINHTPNPWHIPSYDGNGNLKTNAPVADNDCVNLSYFNANASSWKSIRKLAGELEGQFMLPSAVSGHYINLVITVDYRRFDDFNDKHTAIFGLTPWRANNLGLPVMTKTLTGLTDDTEMPAPTIELADSPLTQDTIMYTLQANADVIFYNGEVTLHYQDLGPSFVNG